MSNNPKPNHLTLVSSNELPIEPTPDFDPGTPIHIGKITLSTEKVELIGTAPICMLVGLMYTTLQAGNTFSAKEIQELTDELLSGELLELELDDDHALLLSLASIVT